MNTNLNELAKRVHEQNKDKGWHDEEYSNEHYLMLVVESLSDASRADRKGKRADLKQFNNHIGNTKKIFEVSAFEMLIKDTVEDKLADAYIRLLDLAGLRGYDLEKEYLFVKDKGFTNDSFNDRSFTEVIYLICWIVYSNYLTTEQRIVALLKDVTTYCEHLNIDLQKHVELKLEYSKTLLAEFSKDDF